jgi:Icc-related predicted phosphoesterase
MTALATVPPLTLGVVSDTHGAHTAVAVPAVDLLLCAGDLTRRGTWPEIHAFLDWFADRPARARALIAGNHDAAAAADPSRMAAACADRGVHWLLDSGVTLLGLSLWGSPYTPRWRSFAFQEARGAALAAHWEGIPAGLDILLTHGPPRGIGDRAVLGRVGCDALRATVLARPPRLHLFGHIHEDAGDHRVAGCPTHFVNAASARLFRLGTRPARVIDWPPQPGESAA